MRFFFVVFTGALVIMESSAGGLKKDGSVKCQETDYCLEFMRHFTWTNVQRSTGEFPWITQEEFQDSYTFKYLNYEMEDGYINPDDPLHTGESLRDLRKNETRVQSISSKRKRTANAKESEFQSIAQGVKEVKGDQDGTVEDDEEDEDVFLDEYGNVIEPDKADTDLSAKAKALMNDNVENSSSDLSKSEKPTRVQKPQEYLHPKQTWKDLDNVRDVRHAPQEQSNRKPMFKSHYIGNVHFFFTS